MLRISKKELLDWHPRYEMAYSSITAQTLKARWLYFRPDFALSTITYIVRKQIDHNKYIEKTFNNLDEAIDYYNDVWGE